MRQDTIQLSDALTPVERESEYSGSDTLQAVDSTHTDSVEASPKSLEIPSILQPNTLEAKNLDTKDIPYGNEDWITIHLVLSLVVLAWVRLFYNKRLKQVFRSIAGIRFQGMMVREGNVLRERISIALMVVYLISISLMTYLFFTRILHFELFQLKSFKLFSLLMLLVIFSWILKNLANTILGKVFQNPVILSDYLLTNFIFNISTGVVLLPIIMLAVYLPSVGMIYLGLFVWGISFIYRLIRLVITSLSYTKFSFYNRILYLCTFELIPIIVLTKLIMSNLS